MALPPEVDETPFAPLGEVVAQAEAPEGRSLSAGLRVSA